MVKVALISDFRNIHAQKWARILNTKVDKLFVISVAASKLNGLNVYNLNMINYNGYRIVTLIKKLRYIVLCWIILNREKPDIVHVHYLRTDISIFGYLFHKNIIISVWGNDIIDDNNTSSLKKIYRRIALKRAKIITATTNYLANYTYKFHQNKTIHVVPFGVDLKKFNPKNYIKVSNSKIHIAFVKHLTEKYGPHILISSARYIKNDVIIHIAGEGNMQDFLEELSEKNSLSCIVFEGFIPQDSLAEFLSKIDIFVMPSIYNSETFGVSAIEAQAMGIPVIASDIGGVKEAIINDNTGILIPPNNPVALATAIDKLIDDKKLYKKLSSNCRNFIKKNFNLDNNANSIYKLYRSMLD